jgi:hypothetical protein
VNVLPRLAHGFAAFQQKGIPEEEDVSRIPWRCREGLGETGLAVEVAERQGEIAAIRGESAWLKGGALGLEDLN